MPTGPKHQHYYSTFNDKDGEIIDSEDCRCLIGDDHSDDAEALDDSDAADIWMSNGMDEDYMFGYSESELSRAKDRD